MRCTPPSPRQSLIGGRSQGPPPERRVAPGQRVVRRGDKPRRPQARAGGPTGTDWGGAGRGDPHIEALGGTVTSVSGLGLVALFGAPESHEDDPERALRASFRIVSGSDVANGALSLRAGVETGRAVVGHIRGRLSRPLRRSGRGRGVGGGAPTGRPTGVGTGGTCHPSRHRDAVRVGALGGSRRRPGVGPRPHFLPGPAPGAPARPGRAPAPLRRRRATGGKRGRDFVAAKSPAGGGVGPRERGHDRRRTRPR